MKVKERDLQKERKRASSPWLLASIPLNCVLACWDFQLHLFTNLWGESLLSGRVRKSALTCCAALRGTLNVVPSADKLKVDQENKHLSTLQLALPALNPGSRYFIHLCLWPPVD